MVAARVGPVMSGGPLNSEMSGPPLMTGPPDGGRVGPTGRGGRKRWSVSTRDRSGPVATVFRPALERLAAHQPPAMPAGQERPCRLAANESPYAALPEVRQAITA